MGQIIMLGTGDPLNDERVQTSLAVPLDGGDALLIDTTSGTALLRQLRAAGLGLAGIRHVVVTHRHFDHAGGLAPLLTALAAVPAARLTVYALPDTLRALHALLALTIPGVEEWLGARLTWRALTMGAPVAMGSVVVTPVAVDHGIECAGLRLALGDADVVFSADTQPCPALVAHARGTDLLIHEAYGVAATAAEAHRFGHSTAIDAGCVARDAGAGRQPCRRPRRAVRRGRGGFRPLRRVGGGFGGDRRLICNTYPSCRSWRRCVLRLHYIGRPFEHGMAS